MATMAPLNEMEADEPEFKPMTAEEARQWSEKNPSVSPGAVVGVQALVGLVVALVAWGLTGRENVGWSAGYGALAVVIPAALFARGLARKWSLENPQARAMGAAFGFFIWEMVKAGCQSELASHAGRTGGVDEGVLGGARAPPEA